jgi:hypothetical protein
MTFPRKRARKCEGLSGNNPSRISISRLKTDIRQRNSLSIDSWGASPMGVRVVSSTLHHIHGQTAAGSLLVFGIHVATGGPHGLNDFVEGNKMAAIGSHRQS